MLESARICVAGSRGMGSRTWQRVSNQAVGGNRMMVIRARPDWKRPAKAYGLNIELNHLGSSAMIQYQDMHEKLGTKDFSALKRDYGVALQKDGKVDASATRELRRKRN